MKLQGSEQEPDVPHENTGKKCDKGPNRMILRDGMCLECEGQECTPLFDGFTTETQADVEDSALTDYLARQQKKEDRAVRQATVEKGTFIPGCYACHYNMAGPH